MWPCIGVAAVALKVTVEACAADAENLCRAKAVAVAHLKNFLDVDLADLVERERLPVFITGKPRRAVLEMFGEVAEVDEITRGRNAGGGDDIFEFSDIAGPGVLEEDRLGAAGEASDLFAVSLVVFLEEELDEKRNVLEPLGERRDADLDRAETVIEIFAEAAGEDFGSEVAVGGGNETDVDLLDLRRADTLDFAVLDNAKKFGLHDQRSFAHLIEEHGTAVGVFKEARTSVRGAGEGATDMAEELALKEGIDQSGTVANRQALLADRADLVDGAGNELFARPGVAYEENVGVMTRHFAGEIEDFEHGRAFADDAVKFEVLEELLFQGANTAALVVERGDVIECAFEANLVDRPGKKIGGPAADGLESGFQGVFGGHQNHVNPGVAAESAGQEFVGIVGVQMNAGKDQAAAADTNQA